MKQRIHITVRDLVERVCRSGDLEAVFCGTARSLAGIRAHREIQLARPAMYQKEVPLADVVETEHVVIELSGRIDGVFQEPEIILEEIKTTFRSLAELKAAQDERHWAQLKIYAYLYARLNRLETLRIQLTYCRLPDNERLEITRDVDMHELQRFFTDLVGRYLAQLAVMRKWRATRDASIRRLAFPHAAYRPGQRELAVHVYRAIADAEELMAQAPTGIGKTIAVLFPAIKSLAEGKGAWIFYLTARSTGKTVAEETLAALIRHGLRLKCLTLTAREKICFNPGAVCTGDECEFARGYYDRLDAALMKAIRQDMLNRDAVESAAREHGVCPFEFSLDLALFADCIIGDYNYAFDPSAYVKRLFTAAASENLLLIDEAHNLVDRAREMFSAELKQEDILLCRRKTRHVSPELHRCLVKINRWLRNTAKELCDRSRQFHSQDLPDDLIALLHRFVAACDRWLSDHGRHALREMLLDLYFKASRFIKIAEFFDERYAVCYEAQPKAFRVKLFCIDPSQQLRKRLETCRAVVFFSATLTPAAYYHMLFGCGGSARGVRLRSPFPSENFCLLIDSRLSTYLRDRTATRGEVAENVEAFVRNKKGNYLVFFPSYEYMRLVAGDYSNRFPHRKVLQQEALMTEIERNLFLDRFRDENRETLVGFVVLGGVFGEGIDLPGDRLSGAVIVGVGLPPPTREKALIQAYFDRSCHAGFEFAYIFPGFNRVLQACGRVIRSETDLGGVLLLDRRFAKREYTALFPADWRPTYVHNAAHLEQALRRFWREKKAIRMVPGN